MLLIEVNEGMVAGPRTTKGEQSHSPSARKLLPIRVSPAVTHQPSPKADANRV